MRILITGGSGQVAYDLKQVVSENNVQFYAPSHSELSILDREAISLAIEKFRPTHVINTAAFTQVDLAEQNQEAAFLTNKEGVKNLAIVCEKFQCPLLHLSTDYVFDGEKNSPYVESDIPHPLNVYGQSKLEGERCIKESNFCHLIIRVSGIFGVHGNNFVKTILHLAREREELHVVNDQHTCPTASLAIAKMLMVTAKKNSFDNSIYHYCGSPAVTWYGFAKEIIEVAKEFENLRVKEIFPIAAADFKSTATRPRNSVLNCEKISSSYGVHLSDWKEDLRNVIKKLYTA